MVEESSTSGICLKDSGTCTECGHGCPCACKGCACSAPNPALPDLDAAPAESVANNPVFCSFCGRNQRQVRAIVSGPATYICNACWGHAAEVMGGALGVPPAQLYAFFENERTTAIKSHLERMAADVQATGGPVVIDPTIDR